MRIAFAGNPNSGKTTMYNALTGRNEKVGNWAGVTVDKKVILWKISSFSRWLRLSLPCPADICTGRRNAASSVSVALVAVPAREATAAASAESRKNPRPASKPKPVLPHAQHDKTGEGFDAFTCLLFGETVGTPYRLTYRQGFTYTPL